MRSAVAGGLALALLAAAAPAQAVLGGSAAAEGAYPFTVSVDAGERGCSGVLVQAELILTAKDCFGDVPADGAPPASATFATVGRTDLTQNTGVRVAVTEVIPHPELNLVLGRLATPVTGIAPVRLGAAATPGETLLVAGYGRTATEWVPDKLHVAEVTVGEVSSGGFGVAAADGGATTCQGDAGGPALRTVSGGVELVGVHDSGYQGGCYGATGDRRDAVETRADQLGNWIGRFAAVPDPIAEVSDNLARDATFTASSSAPESWGWSLRTINDGVRDKNGWSSWSQTEVDHTEWVEFAFPATRQVNRVDLYPRLDVPGGSFPVNFTISTWTGSAWETVLTRTNFPNPGITPVRLSFPLKATSKVRIQGTQLRLMQLSEVEAYQSVNLAADATFTASSSAPESWGWSLRTINDGVRDLNGWSSWSQTEVDHTEWLEMAFPEAREVGRVDLYPRLDVPGGSFPVNFTISAWTGSAWETILTRTNFPNPGVRPVRLIVPARTTSKLRIQGTQLRLMQFSEVEAYRAANLAAEATFTASSSAPDSWGWSLSRLNDGHRERSGWSSWSQTEVDHTEWLEFAFPAARRVNRIELYPRVDVPGGSFPANFTISAWTGSAWEPVVTKRNFPNPGVTPVRLTFAPRTTTKFRLEATAVRLVQFNEVAAYDVLPSAPVTPRARQASVVEPRDYPGAADILAARGIHVYQGDGHITLVDCGANPNVPPAELILVQTYDLTLPGGPDFCFRGRGTSGFLTMEIDKAFTVRGDNAHTVAARVETADDQTVVETERVDPREWQPVGIGQSRGEAKILELRYPYTT